MSEDNRLQLIAALTIWTGYNESAFIAMTDDELQKEYDRRMGDM